MNKCNLSVVIVTIVIVTMMGCADRSPAAREKMTGFLTPTADATPVAEVKVVSPPQFNEALDMYCTTFVEKEMRTDTPDIWRVALSREKPVVSADNTIQVKIVKFRSNPSNLATLYVAQ